VKNFGEYERLVAEILLQKTRAENIVDVYNEFLKKYPTYRDLAVANYRELVDLLRPLGLYRNRSKNLINLGKELAKMGKVPDSSEELIKLPGIGPYIANAFLVFTHNRRLPIVDTNIRRVCERVFSIETKRDPRRDPETWDFVDLLMPEEQPRDFMFALLDFSAIICKKREPEHDICPVSNICNFLSSESKQK